MAKWRGIRTKNRLKPFCRPSGGRVIFNGLPDLVERLTGGNASLESERQELRDEINRLKGEQGKPDIKADKKKAGDISSKANANQIAKTRANKAELSRVLELPGLPLHKIVIGWFINRDEFGVLA